MLGLRLLTVFSFNVFLANDTNTLDPSRFSSKVKEPPYTAAGQIESRFVRPFTPAIEQKPQEAQKPRQESYKRQQTLLLPHRTWRYEQQ